jgi:hypothetical protein
VEVIEADMDTADPGGLVLEADSRLIEDFLHTLEVFVDATKPAPLTVFTNANGETEALALSRDGEIHHVAREPASDSGWNVYGAGAAFASISAGSDALWAVGAHDGGVWRLRGGRWTRTTLPDGMAALAVSAGIDGIVRVLGRDAHYARRLYASTDGVNWEASSPPWVYGASRAPQGSAGNLWVADDNGGLHADTGSGWVDVPRPDGCTWASQVSVAPDGSVWLLCRSGDVYRREGTSWRPQSHAGAEPAGGAAAAGTGEPSDFVVVSATEMWMLVLLIERIDKPLVPRLRRLSGGTWQDVPNPPLPAGVSVAEMRELYLAASPEGFIWLASPIGLRQYVPSSGASSTPLQPSGMAGFTAGGNVTEVVAGCDPGGGQHALWIQDGSLYHSAYADGAWRAPTKLFDRCSNLGATKQYDSKALIGYATTSDGQFVVATQSGGTWSARAVHANTRLDGVRVQLIAKDDRSWFVAAVIGGQLQVGWGSAGAPLGTGDYGGDLWPVAEWADNKHADPPGGMREVVSLPWDPTEHNNYVAVLDTSGQLHMVFNITFAGVNPYGLSGALGSYVQFSQAPLDRVESAAGVIDGDRHARVYATDSQNRLWVIRQTGSTGNFENPWTWTAWHPLGDECALLADGPQAVATNDLFVLDGDHLLARLYQNPIGGSWALAHVARPTGAVEDPVYVPQYATTVTVSDSGGTPQPAKQVAVSCSEPASVWVEGVQHTIRPGAPYSLTTDRRGQLQLATLALGLHSPQLTFTVAGAAPRAVYPPAVAHERLAGVDATTLKGATARTQGHPATDEPLLPDPNSPNLGAAVEVIKDTFAVKKESGIDGGTVTPALSAARVAGRPAGTVPTAGDFWSELEHFGEDVFHAARNGLLAVEKVEVVQRALQLTLRLEGIGERVLNLAIATIHDVTNAFHTAFVWLKTTVERVVDWLKELFDWTDIINTHAVVFHFVDRLLVNAAAALDPGKKNNAQQLLLAQFDNLKRKIDQDFDKITAVFGTKSFTQHVAGHGGNPAVGSDPLHAEKVQSGYGDNRTKCDYAHAKAQGYGQQGGTFVGAPAALAAAQSPLVTFLAAVEKDLDLSNPDSRFRKDLAKLEQDLGATLADPHGLFEMGVAALLRLLQGAIDTVLDLGRDVLKALLDAAAEAVRALRELLEAPIEVPVLSWLFRKITGQPLSVLGLFCLLLAVPATLLYKLIFGGKDARPPFTADDVDRILKADFRWPIPGTAAPAARAAPGVEFPFAFHLFVLNQAVVAITDIAADGYATEEIGPFDPDAGTWDPAATLISVLSVVSGAAAQAFATPVDTFQKPREEWSPTESAVVMQWAALFAPWLLNVVFLCGTKKKAIAEFADTVGPALLTLCGMFALAVGLVETLEEPDSGDPEAALHHAIGIIAPFPVAAKVALMPKNAVATTILMVIDGLCDIATGALTLAAGDVSARRRLGAGAPTAAT